MRGAYSEILGMDPEFCASKDVELLLWKNCYYKRIEVSQRQQRHGFSYRTGEYFFNANTESQLVSPSEAPLRCASMIVVLQRAFVCGGIGLELFGVPAERGIGAETKTDTETNTSHQDGPICR